MCILAFCLDHIKELNLIAFPVCSDRFIQRHLPGGFFLCPKIHQNLIFNTPCRVRAKSYTFIGVKSDDRFDEADGSNGQKILRILLHGLILFHNMCCKAQIPLYQNMFCFKITLCIFLQIISFFRSCEGLRK